MSKTIHLGQDARTQLRKGIDLTADAVISTLGPGGHNVIIEKFGTNPHVTKDGVTVAKEISFEDPLMNMGADLLKQAALSTANEAGDGTTTSTALVKVMLEVMFKLVESGSSPMSVIDMFKGWANSVEKDIVDNSMDIDIDGPELAQVASISANNDKELGTIIAEAIQAVGKDGRIVVEESRGVETTYEKIEGIRFDKGYMSESFINDTDRMRAVYEEPFILFIGGRLHTVQQIEPALKFAHDRQKPLVIVVDDVIEQALNVLIANKLKQNFPIVAIKSPSYGDNRKDVLIDMAISTGGQVYTDVEGLDLNDMHKLSEEALYGTLGIADKVVISKHETLIIGGGGEKDDIAVRIAGLKAQIKEGGHEFQINNMKERLSSLENKVASIKVGGANEIEMKQRKDRVEDAVAATQSALEQGIVIGGGYALLTAGNDNNSGLTYLTEVASYPARVILDNANLDADDAIRRYIAEGVTYNAATGVICNLIEEGIVDPTKVVISALRNAIAVATLILQTKATVSLDTKPRQVGGPDMPPGFSPHNYP